MPLKIINWVCYACGKKHGTRHRVISTWHIGTCDVCGREIAVTEPRDFGMPWRVETSKKEKKNHE